MKPEEVMLSSADENQRDIRIQDLQEALRLGLAVVTEMWSYSTKDWISSVHAADVDGDGDIEVLLGSRNHRFYLLTKLGNLKREVYLESEWVGTICGIDTTQAVDDTRIIVGTRDNTVYAFNEVLQPIWEYAAGLVIRQIEVGDIDGDGKMEVVVCSEDRCIHVLECESGALLWKYKTNAWIRSIAVADVDGDGAIEVLGGSGDNYLHVLDEQGKLKWRYHAGAKIYSLFTADVDGDGVQEILVSTDAKDLYMLALEQQEGKLVHIRKWRRELSNRVLTLYAVDVNKDGRLEILAGSEDKHLYIFDDRGQMLWKHYLGARIFSIYVKDVDRDGLLEVFVGADDNSVHALRIELNGGERERILNYYALLGKPAFSKLNLSPTEITLLQVLVDGQQNVTGGYTLRDLEEARRGGDSRRILEVLLELEEQKVQLQWSRDVGYVRTLDLSETFDARQMEMVVGTTQGIVYALRADGSEHWHYQLGERIRAIQVGDIDHDGEEEVVVGLAGGRVCVLNKAGDTVKWSSQLEDWITSIWIAPITASDRAELITGSEEKRITVYGETFLPVLEPIIAPQGIYTIMASDINGDGETEIIAGAVDDNVYAYRSDGTLIWKYKTRDRVRALVVEDIDKDGHKEIVVGSEDRTIHVLNDAGTLEWRYYTPHRVLDLSVADVNGDGNVEVFLGCGDGTVYVLNAQGEDLWRYTVNDRIRIVRAGDIDHDGTYEIVVGSEDRLYLLKLFDLGELGEQIEGCWRTLEQKDGTEALLEGFLQHRNPVFRVFVCGILKARPDLLKTRPAMLGKLVNDPSPLVRCAVAHAIPIFYKQYRDAVRRFFDTLASDREQDVRLAFVRSLPALVMINRELGFAYLDRFTKNVNLWVRHAVVRELYGLAKDFPEQVFRLLMITSQDDRTWVRQESARSLAHYFDLHTDKLIEGSRSLIAKRSYLDVHELISHQATNAMIRNVFRVMVDLFSELNEANLQEKLSEAVKAFADLEGVQYGREVWQFYNELYHLSLMRNIEEIARYRYTLDEQPSLLWVHFEDTLQVLRQLTTVSNALNAYLRREGLGDRLASLYEANKTIDVIYAEVKDKVSEVVQDDTQQLFDIAIFRLVLKRWRSIVTAELSRLVGRAELRLEVQARSLAYEETVSFWLTICNDGNSPADTVTVRLIRGKDFEIGGSDTVHVELVPSRDSVQVEFTIRPLTPKPHLTFEVTYDDADAKGKTHKIGHRLDLHVMEHEYQIINNPYSVGMPIRDGGMFYGRQEDLAILKTDLTNPEVNVTIVLYGQRRSGKTSLLNQLVNTDVLAPHIPVYIDMQNESLSITISKFLRNIAHYIQKALKKRGITIQQPGLKEFEDDPTFVFNCFLDEVEGYLQERKLILCIDEFEILEQKVKEKDLPQEVFEYLRSLMQHRENMNFLFSGTHTIKQLTANYWSVFFNIARHYKLTKLGEEAATQLIVRPVEGKLEYDPFAIKKIRQLTADQPYLIQLICRSVVDYCNAVQKGYVTINDVNTVLDTVMETGEVHFQWIWEQTDQQERLVLAILAQEGGDDRHLLSLGDIEEVYVSHGLPYDHKKVLQALLGLREKDIIESSSNNTRFRVLLGLSQRWLREAKSLRRVMLEENVLRAR
jgi:outer membrane protein assembly factor BamB/AAA+ ATPase superfamily predicted ATPase